MQLRAHAPRVCLRFLPRRILPEFVAKARSDGMRGYVVVPFTPSDPTWPALAAASLTSIDGQLTDPCIVQSDPAAYVRVGDDLGGAQRLAVMAVDFGRWGQRASVGFAPPCGWHAERRQAEAWYEMHVKPWHLELAMVGMRILSQVISASSCERNWSAHGHIHTKICNKLGPETTEKLVYVYSNTGPGPVSLTPCRP